MSPTTTMTLTYARPRRLSLSLLAPRTPPPLLNLPAELVLDILELCLKENRPSTLTVVCKAISGFVDAILYRIVVLDSRETVNLFHRTTLSKPPTFFATHVKKLVLAYNPSVDSIQFRRVLDIVAPCSGLRSLVLPSGYEKPAIQSILHALSSDGLAEILIHSHQGLRTFDAGTTRLDYTLPVTHLRVCEPGDGFVAPCSLLSAFGSLPRLSHLQLARRINSNEDNDQVFVDDVVHILETRPELTMLVVSIFPLSWSPTPQASVIESSIWDMLQKLSKRDKRLLVRLGEYKEWNVERDGVRRAKLGETSDFWVSSKYNEMMVQAGARTEMTSSYP
ncbi:hypothetical protein V5O48_010412 [Marasmius crinis-equi]|uniref:F-box domain-containing protein n=1 Tax=Marasmius crinis-equi TaxID=585013 RepID=A0ABR3F8K8_9AGAR